MYFGLCWEDVSILYVCCIAWTWKFFRGLTVSQALDDGKRKPKTGVSCTSVIKVSSVESDLDLLDVEALEQSRVELTSHDLMPAQAARGCCGEHQLTFPDFLQPGHM